MRAFSGRKARLRFTPELWSDLFAELGRRGRGVRESGGFLLSPRPGDGRTVTAVAYLDDLDPECLVGGIHFHREGYGKLWSICDRDDVRVVADVHTHPSTWVGQSGIDRANPMVARVGHLALIFPCLGQRHASRREIGVHEYQGESGWRASYGSAAARLLYVGRWA